MVLNTRKREKKLISPIKKQAKFDHKMSLIQIINQTVMDGFITIIAERYNLDVEELVAIWIPFAQGELEISPLPKTTKKTKATKKKPEEVHPISDDEDEDNTPKQRSYNDMTVAQLKTECKMRRLQVAGGKKQDFIDALNKADEHPLEEGTRAYFEIMNIKELKSECKKRGKKVDGKKEDLIERLLEPEQEKTLEDMNAQELKTLCKDGGFITTGKKEDMIERLRNPFSEDNKCFAQMSAQFLKKLCKEQNLDTQGTHEDLVARLLDPNSPKKNPVMTGPEVPKKALKDTEMTSASLKAKCTEYGLATTGTKADLQKRIKEHEEKPTTSKAIPKSKKDKVEEPPKEKKETIADLKNRCKALNISDKGTKVDLLQRLADAEAAAAEEEEEEVEYEEVEVEVDDE
jgi:hypothetical protein